MLNMIVARCSVLSILVMSPANAFQGKLAGDYCGRYLGGLAKVSVKVVDDSHIGIDMNVFGQDLSCPNESYSMDASGHIALTQEHNASDCLKAGFEKRGQDPSSVSLTYNAQADSIHLIVTGVATELTHGGCKLQVVVAAPSGEYCGRYLGGLAKVSVKVVDDSHMGIDMNVFGQDLSCPNEPYSMDASGHIALTQEHNASDCLKVGFEKRGQDPSSVSLTYNAHADSIHLTVTGVATELTHGGCKLQLVVAAPSGEYCGSYLGGLAKVSVKVVDDSHMGIDMNVFGQDLSCPNEPYSMDASGHIALTHEHNASDCLKTGFEKRGQDPSSVGLTYNAQADSIHLTVTGIATELTHVGCKGARSVLGVTSEPGIILL